MTEGTPRPPTDATSAEAVARLVAAGWNGNFYVRPGGLLECGACGSTFDAANAHIDELQRFEAMEDPADGEVVVAITCAECAERGVLVLGYGPASNPDDQDVLVKLGDARR